MLSEQIEKTLTYHLTKNLPHHKVVETYQYATSPSGKLFRPHLVWSILQDINEDLYFRSKSDLNSDHAKLSSAVEFHHTYSLLHDDLPCMDNDLTRRGKACTHLVFGEWQALLAGDGLLNISYQLLSKIKHSRSIDLFRFFSWALGPKGLIHGQVLDLSGEISKDLNTLLRTHELKTARLIQVSILGSAMIAGDKNLYFEKKLFRYSRLLGILFQLIDDLSELVELEINDHEKVVNPWINFTSETYKITLDSIEQFQNLINELKLIQTNKILVDYFTKMTDIIEFKSEEINKHLSSKLDLTPLILAMKSVGKL
jgi:geranylgeranyl pyrophosphate synthase